ncbi:ABC transporter F family member 4 isoform X1 [Rhipicephalus sanguineus]|uniref:ABC transporter F family member 4 isoform X1 n=2 Tax=Rhipicephalus sanguineus TaxID=34632 RepID=UPI0018962E58|nr:ABC transporter F family member 4 isoform X1 [Rhipicephalus sanguineus]
MKERPSYAYSERLMKQMGWSEGKGLGKNEDGSPDFIRPKKKVNTKGIGFNGVDDRWIEHQEAFDSLLSNLNDGNPAAKQDKLISVEERAFKLGGRVHYSKFLRGKDLSQKKEEDLNAIVVKRRKKKDSESVQEADVSRQEDLSGVKTHTSSMSYQEYFAQRMNASKRRKGLNENGDLQPCQKSEETVDCSGGEDGEIKSGKKSKTYEKNNAQNERTSCTDEDVVGTGLALSGVYAEDACSFQGANVQCKKKKKSKHKPSDGGENQWSEMSAKQQEERLMGDPAEIATMPEEPCWEGGASKRRRKPKHADDSEQTLHEPTASHTELYSEDVVSQRVKRKSRHKSRDGDESQAPETITSFAEGALEDDTPRRRKRSKCTAEKVSENDEQAVLETTVSQVDFHTEDSAPRVKKKSKLKPDHGSASQGLQANGSEQWGDGDYCFSEAVPSSTKHSVEDDVPKQTKKPKSQPSPSTDGILKPLTGTVLPASDFCSEESMPQQKAKKKPKHRPTPSVVDEEQPETCRKETAGTGLKEPLLELCLEEELPKRATRKPKLKASEVPDKTDKPKGHTESAEDIRAADRRSGKTSPLASGQCEAVVEQHGKSKKKLKRDLAEEEDKQIEREDYMQVGNGCTSKATVLAANAEALSEDCELRKSKQKQEEKKREDAAELHAKGKARKGSSQLQEAASKKCEQEQEQNDEYENQIEGARVKTKTASKRKPKEDTSSSETNLQQEQTNQNTKGTKRPKQGLEDIAAPKKRHSEERVVQTSNIPLKKQKEGSKSAGSKLKQEEEGTTTKPVSEKPVQASRPTFVPGHCQRNAMARSAASSHCEGPRPRRIACSLGRLETGTWEPYFKPNVNLRAIDGGTAASMAQWVVDTVEDSGNKITPYKACHLDKEAYAMMLGDHIYRWHSTSNWMQIPGYGSDSWLQGTIKFLAASMRLKHPKDAPAS